MKITEIKNNNHNKRANKITGTVNKTNVVNTGTGRTRDAYAKKQSLAVMAPGRPSPPPAFYANVNPFNQSAYGAKYPDDCTYPSVPYQARSTALAAGDATYFLNTNVYRYHPVTHRVGATSASASSWAFTAARGNTADIDSLSTLTNAFGLTRTIGFGVRISAQQNYASISGFCHMCVVPDIISGTVWNYPTTIAAMQSYTTYNKFSMADILQNPVIFSSQFYGPNAREYRDPSLRDNDTTAVTFVRNSTGWGAIVVALTGISAAAGDAISLEYIAHLECLPKVLQAAGQLPIQSTPSPSQPFVMAALTTTVPHTPVAFHEIEAKGQEVIQTLQKAWNLGVAVARAITPVAEGAFALMSAVFG